jgi:phospho-N-acetylmuramoyl-pentapeptide-transferase
MALYLGILIFSFILTSIAVIPFINLLFRLHLTYHHPLPSTLPHEAKEFKALNRVQEWKIGTPIGGGVLIIVMTTISFVLLFPSLSKLGVNFTTAFSLKEELNVLFFTFISFGMIGLYDDIVKIFNLHSLSNRINFWAGKKTVVIFGLGFLIAAMMHLNLNVSIINIPFIGVVNFGWWYVLIAGLLIGIFSKSFDITDGLDGLACGVLLISLLAFWAISLTALDTTISIFIALLIGGLIALLYFNVYPARIWLGNAGSLSFGATLCVVGLLLGKTFALLIVGLIFLVEGFSQLAQFVSIKTTGKKIFSITPLHYWLLSRGWAEPKVVARLWLSTILLAVIGLWFASL